MMLEGEQFNTEDPWQTYLARVGKCYGGSQCQIKFDGDTQKALLSTLNPISLSKKDVHLILHLLDQYAQAVSASNSDSTPHLEAEDLEWLKAKLDQSKRALTKIAKKLDDNYWPTHYPAQSWPSICKEGAANMILLATVINGLLNNVDIKLKPFMSYLTKGTGHERESNQEYLLISLECVFRERTGKPKIPVILDLLSTCLPESEWTDEDKIKKRIAYWREESSPERLRFIESTIRELLKTND